MASAQQTSTHTTIPSTSKPKFFYGWWIVIAGGIMLAVTTTVYTNGSSLLLNQIGGIYSSAELSEGIHEESLGLRNLNVVFRYFPITFWIGMLISPFVGTMVARFGVRRIVLLGTMLGGAGYLLVSTTQTTWDYHAAVIPLAIGMNLCSSVVFVATVGKWFIRRRVRAFAILMIINALGSMGTVFLGLAISVFDWRVAMMGVAVLVLLVGVPIAFVMRNRPEDRGTGPDGDKQRSISAREISPSVGQILRLRPFWQITVALSLVAYVGTSSAVHDQILDLYDSENSLIVAITLSSGIFVPIGMVTIAFVGDRHEKKDLLTKLIVLKAVALVIVAMGLTQLLPGLLSLVPVLIAQVISNFATGMLLPLSYGVLADYFGRERLGAVIGINSSINGGIVLVAAVASCAFLIGFRDFSSPFSAGFVFALISILIAVYLSKTLESQSRVAARLRVLKRRVAAS